jgi:hypothetical protein
MDEWLQIAIEYAIDIANFNLRSMVFHHSVWLQNIRADLRSEIISSLSLDLPGDSRFFSISSS